jgi:hypothetical protein
MYSLCDEQAACQSLGLPDPSEAIQRPDPEAVQQCAAAVVGLCLCSERLSQRNTYWDVTSTVLQNLSTWWRQRMSQMTSSMSDDEYLDIVAR